MNKYPLLIIASLCLILSGCKVEGFEAVQEQKSAVTKNTHKVDNEPLIEHYHEYLEAKPGIAKEDKEEIEALLNANPEDPDLYWKVSEVFERAEENEDKERQEILSSHSLLEEALATNHTKLRDLRKKIMERQERIENLKEEIPVMEQKISELEGQLARNEVNPVNEILLIQWKESLDLMKRELQRHYTDVGADVEQTKNELLINISLLRTLAFILDEGKCEYHLDMYHYSDAFFALYNEYGANVNRNYGVEIQDVLTARLESIGESLGFLRYEDENIVNFLHYLKISSEEYDELFFNIPSDVSLKIKEDDLGALATGLFLPPVYLFDHTYQAEWELIPSPSGSSYSGSICDEDTIKKFFTEYDPSEIDFYGLKTRFRWSDSDFDKLIDHVNRKWEFYYKKKIPLEQPETAVCKKHLTSYHTIDRMLIEYLSTKGIQNINSFKANYRNENFNILNFVSYYNITREEFEKIYYLKDAFFIPYNVDAIYSEAAKAKEYFSLE